MTCPTLAELEEIVKIDTNETVNTFSENTLRVWKDSFDKKYHKDHTLDEVKQLIQNSAEFQLSDKEMPKQSWGLTDSKTVNHFEEEVIVNE